MWGKTVRTKQPESEVTAQGYVLRVLQVAWKSEAELRQKLVEKGFTASVVESTLEYVRKLGYINDARYAENLVRSFAEVKSYGFHHAKAKLLQKRIPNSIITHALEDGFGLVQEQQAVVRALQKFGHTVESFSELAFTDKQKILGKLQARGFRSAAIHAALAS